MFTWYVKHAPIKRKLTIAFALYVGMLSAVVAVALYEQSRAASLATDDPAQLKALLASTSHATVLVALLLTLAAVVLGALLNAAIANPYVRTVVRMEGLAAGDLETPVAHTDHRDCVGRMTKAMETFKSAALERDRLQAAAGQQQAELDRQLAAAKEAFRLAGQDQAVVVEGLATALSALAKGDLSARLTLEVAADYQRLRDDFNAAVGALDGAMQRITGNAGAITSGAHEISHAADDLSRRTEQQAAGLEETAAALDQITVTVRRSSEGASQARTVVGQAKLDAERSGEVVRQAVEAMGQIERSSSQIGNIIGVIDEIAFQTNLLALNAGVEAARAGEAGRGFAVVASEVRALAQRSAEAAKEIKGLIMASTQQVESGVALVGETGHALDRIVGQVAEINTLVLEIAASAQEQAQGLGQVNTAINDMDKTTQQNAAMVEQSTAASHAMADQASELAELMQQFRLSGATASPRRRAA